MDDDDAIRRLFKFGLAAAAARIRNGFFICTYSLSYTVFHSWCVWGHPISLERKQMIGMLIQNKRDCPYTQQLVVFGTMYAMNV